MPSIPQIKIGNTTYDVKDKRVDILKGSIDDRELLFQFGLSSTGAVVARRATTDFIPVTGDFEVYSDVFNERLAINMEMFNSSKVSLGDIYATTFERVSRIYFRANAHPDVAFVKVWLSNYNNRNLDLTEDDKTFARRHIKIHDGITIRDLLAGERPSADDFLVGRRQGTAFIKDVYTRGSSTCLFKNDPTVYITQDTPIYSYYLQYYNENLEKVEDGGWCNLYAYTPYSVNQAPYFSVCFAIGTGARDTNVTQTDIEQFCAGFNLHGPFRYGYTITREGGWSQTGGIRISENKRTYIKDGLFKMVDQTYVDVDICCFDAETGGGIVEEYSWLGGPIGSMMNTDNAVRIKDKYIQCVFARNDGHTLSFDDDGRYAKLCELYNAGQIYQIIESISPYEIGDEIKNGYPVYYDSEMKATVDRATDKETYDSVKFVMITDLHDNIKYKLAETTERQIRAIADLHKKVGLDFVICGGDLTDGGFTSKEQLLDKFTEIIKMFKTIGVPVLMLRGNHDDNSYAGTTESLMVSRQEFYTRCCAPFSGKRIPDGKMYYYQDFDEVNTRVVCLDFIDYPWSVDGSGNVQYHAAGGDGVWRGYSDDQIIWLLNTALNCNKRIIITGHYSTHPNLMSSFEKETDVNYTVINQIINAYNSRGSISFGGNTYSFAEKTGKILVQVSGHSHSFGAFKNNGIVWSTTGSPSPEVTNRVFDDTQYETMRSRTYGNITEAHFNLFVCDNSHVNIISFGQMDDLSFDI